MFSLYEKMLASFFTRMLAYEVSKEGAKRTLSKPKYLPVLLRIHQSPKTPRIDEIAGELLRQPSPDDHSGLKAALRFVVSTCNKNTVRLGLSKWVMNDKRLRDDPKYLPQMHKLLDHKDHSFRSCVAVTLLEIKHDSSRLPLAKRAKEIWGESNKDSMRVKESLKPFLWWIAETRFTPAIPNLLDLTLDTSRFEARVLALEAMRRMGDQGRSPLDKVSLPQKVHFDDYDMGRNADWNHIQNKVVYAYARACLAAC